jgi:hypothetical protein
MNGSRDPVFKLLAVFRLWVRLSGYSFIPLTGFKSMFVKAYKHAREQRGACNNVG